jgi:endonuclease YncB( thermonuclease family)
MFAFCGQQITIRVTLFLLIWTFFLCPAPAVASVWKQVIVSYTVDGDTIRGYDALKGSKFLEYFRFSCVDAAEKEQPGGQEAKASLAELAKSGDILTVEIVDIDKYLRPVVIAYSPRVGVDTSLNEIQVRQGNAIVTPEYLRTCPKIAAHLQQEETLARQSQLNIWKYQPLCLPRNYRKNQCSGSTMVSPTAGMEVWGEGEPQQ